MGKRHNGRMLGRLLMGDIDPAEVGEDAFRLGIHRVVFRAIQRAYASHGATDPIVVGHQLQLAGELDQVGGHEYLMRLMESADG